MHLFRIMCSNDLGGTYIIGLIDKFYIDSYQIAYPMIFDRHSDGLIYNVNACNFSDINNLTDRYTINVERIKILYDIGFDFIPHDIKQFYINYLRNQNINYYDQKKKSNTYLIDDEFDLDS